MKLVLHAEHYYGILGAIICAGLDDEDLPGYFDTEDNPDLSQEECDKHNEISTAHGLLQQSRIARLIYHLPYLLNEEYSEIPYRCLLDYSEALLKYFSELEEDKESEQLEVGFLRELYELINEMLD